jgi:subtilisin family serine protease
VTPDDDTLPVLSVGALNPNGRTDALFSNAGPWVRAYTFGAAVLSTLPVDFQGGLQSSAAATAFGRPRDAIDPDDFRGGFAVWSGTSFAGPLMAGQVAAHIAQHLDSGDAPEAARARARAALAELSTITPD